MDSFLYGRKRRHDVNSTDASAVLHLQAHVAFFTPGCAPTVAHNPVLVSAVSIDSKTNDNDGVIEMLSALSRVEDACLVLHELV